ncbi:hypothetical protein Tco_0597668 [Tanacetum coccineum]
MKEEPKKKKLTLQQLRAAETANDEEVARKVAAEWEEEEERKRNDEEVARKVAAEWEEEEERKRLAGLERLQAELEDYEMIAAESRATSSIKEAPPTIPQLRNQMMKYIRNVGGKAYRNLKNKNYEEIKDIYEKVKRINDKFVAIGSTEDEQAIKEMNVKAEEPSKKRRGTIRKMKSSRKIKKRKIQKSDDELKSFLKVMDFEGDSAQDVEVMEQRSLISRFSIVQSPEGEYIAVQRANGHIRAFNTLNEVLHILDRQESSCFLHRCDDDCGNQDGMGKSIRWWRLYESTGVHILELENGTMVHMLAEQRYPLTRELMQRMLEHKLEVQRETEDALNLIRFVMKQKEDLEREEE